MSENHTNNEMEVYFTEQEILNKLNEEFKNSQTAFTKLDIDSNRLTAIQEKLEPNTYIYNLCEALKKSTTSDANMFTAFINELVYLWLNAFDQGSTIDTIFKILKCLKIKNIFGISQSEKIHRFIYQIFTETIDRYHQVSLDYIENYDESVKLPNTKLLENNLATILKHAEKNQITVLFSLHFHTENNALLLPQSASDHLNQQIVDILKKNINDQSQLFFNGAYQFELLTAKLKNEAQIELLVAKIFRAFEEIVFINRQSILLKPYIGCAYTVGHELNARTIYHNAKKALEYGINKQNYFVMYSDELEKSLDQQITLESKVIEAFDTNNLILNFQPIVDLNSNRCVGAELLLRCSENFNFYIAPHIIVEVLNSTGKGKLFTRWLINSASRYASELVNEHQLDIYLTLNLRAEDLYDIELPSLFSNALSLWKLDPKRIIIEITENGILEQNDQTQLIIQELSVLGFKFALDDFGTGFSSLTRLRTLPIDLIKIDQSFVKNIENSTEDYEIVQSITMLAKALGKEVLSEGVENEQTLALIKKLKINKCQGYYFAKPLSYESYINWAQSHS
jgi:EAL domain-containing protein (putative c-di-GMP-specific phosphodiesterase class I)/GGDEF domain-containing protein